MAPNSIIKRYTLTGGENTFSSPASVNDSDARKLQSLIPSLSGALERERPLISFIDTANVTFPSRVGFYYQFKRNNSGTIVSYFFCATATQLYQLQNPGPTQSWAPVLTLAAFPVACTINNTMHLSDGVSSWIYDGISFVQDGMPIPLSTPIISPANVIAAVNISSVTRLNGVLSIALVSGLTNSSGLSHIVISGNSLSGANGTFPMATFTDAAHFTVNQPGLPDGSTGVSGTVQFLAFTVLSNRYYWTTFSDQSATHPHESSSSPTSLGTGPLGSPSNVFIQQRPGTLAVTAGSTVVVGTGTDFSPSDVGQVIQIPIPPSAGYTSPTIASVQDNQHATLSANSSTSVGPGVLFLIAPVRATHWNVYGSSSEEDKLGALLASIPVSGPTGRVFYLDQSPMIGTVGAYFQNVQRPMLNDPTQPATIMEVHKNRIWRNLLTFPNFFTYTGYEEILAEQAGTPSECVPGASGTLTVSPGQINETSYPDQSAIITALRKHGDALFIGTELNVIPLYGSSLADFQLSEAQVFAVGFAGRRSCVSTPFGLAFLSYDLKVYLYPSQYSFGVDSTTALVELGRPKRPEFENIDGADLANAGLTFYNYGRRNWLVFNYRRTDNTFATWVFDFEVKGWFQLQQGYTAITVYEVTPGKRILLGASSVDNKTYVLDDRTGTYPIPVNTIYPVGYFRALLDFGDPASNFAVQNIEFEKSNDAMEVDVTIWLDPVDPENPGNGILIPLTRKRIGANVYTGRPTSETGATCQRILVEFAVAASTQNGFFRGMTVEANKLPVSPTL